VNTSFRFLVVVAALVIASGAGLLSQWHKTLLLRNELILAQNKAVELSQLRAENNRLRGAQIPAAELMRAQGQLFPATDN